jgi:hypothetical protein
MTPTAKIERIVKIKVKLVPKLKAAPGLKTKRSWRIEPITFIGCTWLRLLRAHTFVE